MSLVVTYSYAFSSRDRSIGAISRAALACAFSSLHPSSSMAQAVSACRTSFSTALARSWFPLTTSVSTMSRSTLSPPMASMIFSYRFFWLSVKHTSGFVTTWMSSPLSARYAALTASFCARLSASCFGPWLEASMSSVPVSTLPRAKAPLAVWRLNCASSVFSFMAWSAFTLYSTFGLVGVQASEPYTRLARLACGSMLSGPNTSEMGPYLLCPFRAFTTAMEGEGIPPRSSASRRFSSVRLCTATSSLLSFTSTGLASWNRVVFFTGSSVRPFSTLTLLTFPSE